MSKGKDFLRSLAVQLRMEGYSPSLYRQAEDAADRLEAHELEAHEIEIKSQTIKYQEEEWIKLRRLMRAQAEKPDKQGGIDKDQLTFLKTSAERGNKDAKAILALLKDAENGNIQSQYELGLALGGGGRGLTPDPIRSLAWLYEAAEQGHSLAQYWVGKIYEAGLGVIPNIEAARKWYQKAIDQGVQEAWDAKIKLEEKEKDRRYAERKTFVDNLKYDDYNRPIINRNTHDLRYGQVHDEMLNNYAREAQDYKSETEKMAALYKAVSTREDYQKFVDYFNNTYIPAIDKHYKMLISLKEYEYDHEVDLNSEVRDYACEKWEESKKSYEHAKKRASDILLGMQKKWGGVSQSHLDAIFQRSPAQPSSPFSESLEKNKKQEDAIRAHSPFFTG